MNCEKVPLRNFFILVVKNEVQFGIILFRGDAMKFKKVYIEITNVCNLSCSFCTLNKRTCGFMQEEQLNRILQEVKPYTKYLYFHVLGEPLLHPQFFKFIELAKEQGFYVNITTNGTLLKKRVHALEEHSPRQINVSLHNFKEQDGIDTQVYIKEIVESAKILAQKSYISLRLWSMKEQAFDAETLQVIKELQTYFPFDLNELIEKKKVTLQKNIFLHVEEVFAWPTLQTSQKSDGTCYGMRQQMAILVDGSVSACCLDGDGVMNFGNIYHEPLATILTSPRVEALIKGFEQRKCSEELCRKCTFKTRF